MDRTSPGGTAARREGRIAQLVEQLTLNQRVIGSSPIAPTIPSSEGSIESRREAAFRLSRLAWTLPLGRIGADAASETSRIPPCSSNGEIESMADVRDSNGNKLSDGDSVTVIKDLKVKGTSVTLKRGTTIKNIRLTDDEELIECNAEKVKGLVLRTEFLKKA